MSQKVHNKTQEESIVSCSFHYPTGSVTRLYCQHCWPICNKILKQIQAQTDTHMTVLSSTKMSQLWAGQEMVWREITEGKSLVRQLLQDWQQSGKILSGYLSHSFFYDFGGQVISPALHAELVSTLQACKILEKRKILLVRQTRHHMIACASGNQASQSHQSEVIQRNQ